MILGQATTYSIESVGMTISEFGNYTSDSMGWGIVHNGLSMIIMLCVLFLLVAGFSSMVGRLLGRLKKRIPGALPAAKRSMGMMNILVLLGPVLLAACWQFVLLQRYEYSTLTTLFSISTAILAGVLVVLEIYNRRRALVVGRRWFITSAQVVPISY